MRVIDINGRLATAGSWDETSQSEADAQARLRATRTGLRAMLAGNEAFHVDPMAAPAVVIGVDVAGGPGRSATVTYTRTGSTVRIDTVFMTPAPQLATALPTAKTEPEDEVWHTEAPPVPGFYLVRDYFRIGEIRELQFIAHWDGSLWSGGSDDLEEARRCSKRTHPLRLNEWQWLRLIEADTPAPAAQIPGWRLVCDIPENERGMYALWHYGYPAGGGVDAADPMKGSDWNLSGYVRPAAPGVKQGDDYDESRYSIQA